MLEIPLQIIQKTTLKTKKIEGVEKNDPNRIGRYLQALIETKLKFSALLETAATKQKYI